MRNYKIYALQDPITFKIRYIGITKQSLSIKLRGHLTKAKTTTHNWHKLNWIRQLQKINKKPRIRLVENCNNDLEYSLQREIFWIRYFKKRYNLTNMTLGGEGHLGQKMSKELLEKKSKKVKQYDRKGNLIKIHNSIKDAARYIGKEKLDGKISQVCLGRYGRKTCGGYVWRYENDTFDKFDYRHNFTNNKTQEFRNKVRKRQLGSNNTMAKKVYKLNDNKQVIEKYETIREWCNAHNKLTGQWLKHCINNQKKYIGYYWKYE